MIQHIQMVKVDFSLPELLATITIWVDVCRFGATDMENSWKRDILCDSFEISIVRFNTDETFWLIFLSFVICRFIFSWNILKTQKHAAFTAINEILLCRSLPCDGKILWNFIIAQFEQFIVAIKQFQFYDL